MVAIAGDGLRRRARADVCGEDETHFLATLVDIVETGRTPADRLLAHYEGKWNRSVDPVFTEYAY